MTKEMTIKRIKTAIIDGIEKRMPKEKRFAILSFFSLLKRTISFISERIFFLTEIVSLTTYFSEKTLWFSAWSESKKRRNREKEDR